MRAWVLGLAAVGMLAAAGCESGGGSSVGVMPGTTGPGTPREALAAYYARIDKAALPKRDAAPALPEFGSPITRIAFGSCFQQRRPAPIMSAVQAYDADVMVMMGDNVYGDAYGGDMALPELITAYNTLKQNPDFQRVASATPMIATWDDHDFGLNDAGGSFSAKDYAEDIFMSFWGEGRADQRAGRDGVYTSYMFGELGREVHIILLDTRFFRSDLTREQPHRGPYLPDTDTSKTMLGDAQWRWLAQEMTKPAAVKILVSSVQIIAEGHDFEKWANLPAERQRLFQMIDDAAPESLILISGDRHRAGMYRRDRDGQYPIYEMTSSSLNLPSRSDRGEEFGPNRIGPTFLQENFGALDIDWRRRTVTLSIRDASGSVVQAETLLMRNMAGG